MGLRIALEMRNFSKQTQVCLFLFHVFESQENSPNSFRASKSELLLFFKVSYEINPTEKLLAKKVCDLQLWAASTFAVGTYDDR